LAFRRTSDLPRQIRHPLPSSARQRRAKRGRPMNEEIIADMDGARSRIRASADCRLQAAPNATLVPLRFPPRPTGLAPRRAADDSRAPCPATRHERAHPARAAEGRRSGPARGKQCAVLPELGSRAQAQIARWDRSPPINTLDQARHLSSSASPPIRVMTTLWPITIAAFTSATFLSDTAGLPKRWTTGFGSLPSPRRSRLAGFSAGAQNSSAPASWFSTAAV
jgi:hypothetical protein